MCDLTETLYTRVSSMWQIDLDCLPLSLLWQDFSPLSLFAALPFVQRAGYKAFDFLHMFDWKRLKNDPHTGSLSAHELQICAFFPFPKSHLKLNFENPLQLSCVTRPRWVAEGWGEEENEMWMERSRAERLLWTRLCQWRNWIAPPDNDKVMCSSNRQVQSSAYLCSVELASDCLRGQKTSTSFFLFPWFSSALIFISLKKKRNKKNTCDGAVQPETGPNKAGNWKNSHV